MTSALRFLVAACVLLMGVDTLEAQRVEDLFEEANAAYYEGNYEEAIRVYEQLGNAGVQDPAVDHNLGTAYAKAGQLGAAALYFERALRLDPGAADSASSLNTVRTVLAEQLTRSRGEIETEDSRGLMASIVRDMRESTLAVLFLVFWGLLFIGLMARHLSSKDKSGRLRLASALIAVLGLLFAIAGGFLLATKRGVFQDGQDAIIVASEGELLEGPDPRATTRGEAYEGERATLVDEDGDYVRVVFGDGRWGWMPSDAARSVSQH